MPTVYLDLLHSLEGLEPYPHAPLSINPLNPELNPICSLLALLGAHHFSTLAG